MLAAAGALGRGRRRAAVAAARVLGAARARGPAAAARLHARGRRPGDRRACASWARATGLHVLGPARPRIHRAAGRPAAAARRRRRRDRAAGDPAGRAAGGRRSRPPALLGFRDAAHAAGAALLAGRAGRDRRRQRRAPRPRHRPARGRAATGTRTPTSTPAARRRCSRRSGRCARRATSRRSSRSSPGMACGYGACFGCVVPLRGGGYVRLCVDGPVLERRPARDLPAARSRRPGVSAPVTLLRPRARPPVVNGSGTFDAIAARRVFGDALRAALPVRRVRLQDDHARAARTATRRRGCTRRPAG